MLTILKMNPIGNKGEQPVVYFEFGFDNTIELPKLAFQIGEDISIVANNSIAVNNKTNVVYKFNGDSWVKTNDKYTSSNNSNITTNGNYSIANNSIGGFNSINVEVEPAGLIEKEITENGTYLPADDEATAYSKVVVNVDDSAHFSKICCARLNGSTEVTPFYLYTSSNGEYDVHLQASTYEQAFLASPLTSVTYYDTSTIIFTPSNSFDKNTAFKRDGNYSPITSGSANPTAGDGKIYKAVCNGFGDYSVTITALEFTNSGSTDFNFFIT